MKPCWHHRVAKSSRYYNNVFMEVKNVLAQVNQGQLY